MQLRFMGTGAAFHPAMGNNGAFFARGEDLYLIDCGETAFAALMRAGLLTRYSGRITVLLTHTHADHCGSLGTLCLYAAERLGRPVTVVHPHEQVKTLLSLMGVREAQYTLLDRLDGPGLSATPLPIRHLAMAAFAFRVQDEAEAIYYSGDAAELPKEIVEGLRSGRIARIYQDTMAFSGEPPENPPHLPLPWLCGLIEPALRSRVTVMHYNRDFRDEAKALGFACAQRDPLFDQ